MNAAATVSLCSLCWSLTTPTVKHLISVLNLFQFKAIPLALSLHALIKGPSPANALELLHHIPPGAPSNGDGQ